MKTEQRLILALALSFLIIALYPYVLKTFFPSLARTPVKTETTKVLQEEPRPSEWKPAAARPAEAELRAPRFSSNLETVEKGSFDLKISPAGALIQYLSLTDFGNGKNGSGVLIDARDGPGAFQVWLEGFESASSGNIFIRKKEIEKPGELIYETELDAKIRMVKRFVLNPEQKTIRLILSFANLTGELIETRYELSSQIFFNETGYDHSYVEFNLQTPAKLESKKVDKIKKEAFVHQGYVDWLALTRKYTSVIVKPEANLPVDSVRAKQLAPDIMEAILKTQRFEIPALGQVSHECLIYAGPNRYDDLKSFGYGFQKIISKGWFGPLKLGMLIIMNWCYDWIPNYGVAIILLTVIIKILFTPLTHISFDSMRKMQALNPKIKALQETYKKEPQRLQKELMNLYKKNKVNPLSGCLPLALQMPIFIALYQALSQAVELRGASFFGWIKDLSAPDRLFQLPFSIPFLGDGINVLPLIMIGSMLWQQKLSPSHGMSPEQEKIMFFMPIMFGVVFYQLPSGLVIYWTLSNFLTIFHQLIIKRIPFHLHPD